MSDDDSTPPSPEAPSSAAGSLLEALAGAPELPPEAAARPRPGDRIGRFEILGELGRGGFGVVYQARDTDLGRHVALKILRKQRPELADQLLREAEAAARLSHPNLVTLHDRGVHDGRPYLIFEKLSGETLASRLRKGRLPAPEALAIAADVARGLAHAHAAGMVHRDLKPANVFVTSDGQAKILDFGIARLAAGDGALDGAGTPAYMAPEQRRRGAVDERSDLYALGVTLREMLDPRPPPGAAALVAALCAEDPAERPASAGETLERLLGLARALAGGLEDGAPYRYLDAFREEDAGWFHGRERDSVRLAQRVATRGLVAVVGPSGAGKSSLAHAGLVPRLREQGTWTVVELRPGAEPLARLEERLRTACADAARQQLGPEGELGLRPGRAAETLRAHARATGGRVLLLVDQLEELYTLTADPATRRAFADALLAVADDAHGPLRVVVTLRDDFLGRAAESPGLADAIAGGLIILSAPDAAALAQALEEPARRAGYSLEAGLAQEIVDGLAHERAPLPLLQLAASRLWEQRDVARRTLPRAPLEAAGGVAGLLAAHASDVMSGLDAGEADLARRLLTSLVTADRTRRQLPRDALLRGVGDGGARVLERLIGARLLTSSRAAGVEVIELAHESLIERWSGLRAWLEEDVGDRRTGEIVARAAALWVAEGRPGALLPSGRRLEDWTAWRVRREPAVAADERAFLGAATARGRQRRRTQRALLGLAALATVAAVAAGVAVVDRSQRRAEAAQRALLLARAREARDPVTGSLLLVELAKRGPTSGAHQLALDLARQPAPRAVARTNSPVSSLAIHPADGRIAVGADDGSVLVFTPDAGDPAVVTRHADGIETLAWTPDGAELISADQGGGLRRSRPGSATPPVELPGHQARISRIVFSPDGVHMVTTSHDGTARVWRLDGSAPPVVLRHPTGTIGAAFSRDGTRLAIGGIDRTVRLWSAEGVAEPVVLTGYDGQVNDISFSRDGTRLFTMGGSAPRIWRLGPPGADPGEPLVLRGHAQWAVSGGPSPDEQYLATSSNDGTTRVWRTDGTGAPLVLRPTGGRGVVRPRFSPDGTRIAAVATNEVRLWRVDGTGEPTILRSDAEVGAIAFAADGRRLVTADGPNLRVWDLPAEVEPRIFAGAHHRPPVQWLWMTRDGARLVTASTDSLAVWPAAGGPALRSRAVGHTLVSAVAFSPDETRLVAGHEDGSVVVWSLDGDPAPVALPGHAFRVNDVAWSPDGRRVASAAGTTEVVVSRADGVGPPVVLRHPAPTYWARFVDGGERVITAGDDGVLRIHAADGRGAPTTLAGHDGAIWAMELSPDGVTLLTGSADQTVRSWKLDGSRPPRVIWRGAAATSLSVSPGGDRVLVTRAGLALVVPAEGGEILTQQPHEGDVISGSFSPDGRWVTTVASDQPPAVWRSDGTGEVVFLRGHGMDASRAIFSTSGDRVLTGSFDLTARSWRYLPADLMAFLATRTRACLTPSERQRLLDEPAPIAEQHARACLRAREL